MKVSMRGYVRISVAVAVVIGLVGTGAACSTPRPVKDVRNPDPLGKIPAYKEAVRAKDRRAVRQMVKDLGSDDPAVRMFAIVALRRLTGGDTFGYRYFEDEDQRRAAIQRWEAWLAGKTNDEDDDSNPQEATVGGSGATDAPNPASEP